jgi:hypothetical protein
MELSASILFRFLLFYLSEYVKFSFSIFLSFGSFSFDQSRMNYYLSNSSTKFFSKQPLNHFGKVQRILTINLHHILLLNSHMKKLISAAPLGLKCGTHKSLDLDEMRMLSESAVYEKKGFFAVQLVVCNAMSV